MNENEWHAVIWGSYMYLHGSDFGLACAGGEVSLSLATSSSLFHLYMNIAQHEIIYSVSHSSSFL